MNYIIDRRLNSKKKSTVNRQRFLRRYNEHIKRAVSDAVNRRSITDMESGEQISIPQKDIYEPVFQHGEGGNRTRVFPGNDQFNQGDHIERPQQGEGDGGTGQGASDSGEGEDEFTFTISQEEFLNYVFEDLALPNLIKRQLIGIEEFEYHHAGFSNEGSPGKINIVRSLRSANSRRIALTGKKRKALRKIEKEIATLKENPSEETAQLEELEHQAFILREKIRRVPWLDDFDLKYNLHVKHPVPTSRAVMFCLMDVSGSMTQDTKDTAKRFFLLLYLFLQRNYERIELVFIRHHTSAKEVDEEEFFYSRETGGTIVSSALNLMAKILEDRYPPALWNIYGAQASDGDNWNDDSVNCYRVLTEKLLPKVQHFSYVEITNRAHQSLWHAYEKVQQDFSDSFAMEQIEGPGDIYPVFRDLFKKRES